MFGYCLAALHSSFPRKPIGLPGGAGAPSRTRTPNLSMGVSDRAKHIEIPGSHFSGFAACVRPGMTSVDRDSPAQLEWLRFAFCRLC